MPQQLRVVKIHLHLIVSCFCRVIKDISPLLLPHFMPTVLYTHGRDMDRRVTFFACDESMKTPVSIEIKHFCCPPPKTKLEASSIEADASFAKH